MSNILKTQSLLRISLVPIQCNGTGFWPECFKIEITHSYKNNGDFFKSFLYPKFPAFHLVKKP